MTLGLFYETPVDSRLKAEERLLEALIASESVSFVDPRVLKNEYNWPTTIQALYDGWSGRLKPHDDVEPNNARGDDPTEEMRQALDMCNRLSFMYGMPYAEKNLVSEIHHPGWEMSFDSGKHNPSVGDEIKITGSKAKGILAYSRPLESGAWDTQNAAGKLVLTKVEGDFTKGESLAVKGNIIGTFRGLGETIPPELLNQFGAIPINMYLHGAQNIRRGWAGTYVHRQRAVANQLINIAARKRFTDKDSFDQITLIGSSLNRLWHRESIDRMYEWLMQGNPGNQRKCRKVIFPNYGHQDLLWGKNAYKDVFPEIGKGLPKI